MMKGWISVDTEMPHQGQYIVAADIGNGCIYIARLFVTTLEEVATLQTLAV